MLKPLLLAQELLACSHMILVHAVQLQVQSNPIQAQPPQDKHKQEQRLLNANDDALEWTCSGVEVQGKDGELYWVYMLPFEGSDKGRRVYDECWEFVFSDETRYGGDGGPLIWGHFQKIFNAFETNPDHDMDSSSCAGQESESSSCQTQSDSDSHVAHLWKPSVPYGPKSNKGALKQKLAKEFFQGAGTGATLYAFMVHARTRTVVFTAIWEQQADAHAAGETLESGSSCSSSSCGGGGVANKESRDQDVTHGATAVNEGQFNMFKSGYVTTVQVAKESRGQGACSLAMVHLFAHLQRLYNSENSGAKYLPRLWPGLFQTHPQGIDRSHFLKKILITDGSWTKMSFDSDSPKDRPTKKELADFRRNKRGGAAGRTQAPAGLMETLRKYTQNQPAGAQVYLVDNYEPVDALFQIGGANTPGPVMNHPQPIENFANTPGSSCYRAPASTTTVEQRFQEPAMVLVGDGPGSVYFKEGASTMIKEDLMDWRYTYIYDVGRWGAGLRNEKIAAIPEKDWIKKDDEGGEVVEQEKQNEKHTGSCGGR